MSEPKLTRERMAELREFLDYVWSEVDSPQDEANVELLRDILAALTPPDTLAECEAIVGEAQEGSTFRWKVYGDPFENEFRASDAKGQLEAAQSAVVVKRLTDMGVVG